MFSGLTNLHKKRRDSTASTRSKLPLVWKLIIDELAIVVGVVVALFNIPQLITIWANHDISGVSLTSWTGFFFGSIFWLYYAILHKEKVLVLTFSINLLAHAFIVLGILVH
ncbi:MAG: PQ-loop domain-containing transporter [Patescibacteria group bacterium]|nr:PQ-loop domain-containing transporter [Patescibacteria group bacterium]